MSKKKIDKETAIKSILSDRKKGIDKPTILGKFGSKWEIPKSTYYRWYEEAESQYQKFLAKAMPIIEAKEIEALGELAKSGILSKLERQLILSAFARGERYAWKEAVSKNGVKRLDSYDPLRYIAELNKMDGAYMDELEKDNEFNGFDIQDV